ncbi:MAG: hypothetical protein EU532_05590 [Promethearchaeota archaeon]|nr:MAG: hypothetical protein EU532_05590 [Candidatus Lokiarchaeota archaeon]
MTEILEEKVRKPKKTEEIILEHLKQKQQEITFYQLYKELTKVDKNTMRSKLKITSGGLQSALKRMEKKKKVFMKKRIRRFETLVWFKDFDTDPLIYLKEQDEIIIPFRLDRLTGLVLSEIPKISTEYENVSDLVKQAVIFFSQNNISPSLRKQAISQAMKKEMKIPPKIK